MSGMFFETQCTMCVSIVMTTKNDVHVLAPFSTINKIKQSDKVIM